MDERVVVMSMEAIRSEAHAVHAPAELVADDLSPKGTLASINPPMEWLPYWIDELWPTHDIQHWGLHDDTLEVEERWPYAGRESLLDLHSRWRERYWRACGAHAWAESLVRGSYVEPGTLPALSDYRRLLDPLLGDMWFWLGWLGRYIHNRTKAGW